MLTTFIIAAFVIYFASLVAYSLGDTTSEVETGIVIFNGHNN